MKNGFSSSRMSSSFPEQHAEEMKNYYKRFYSKFDEARYRKLMNGFGLDENHKLRTFSRA
ncbi:MAG: hypothetical protein ACLT4C_05685 [Butyricicoccus sp.]